MMRAGVLALALLVPLSAFGHGLALAFMELRELDNGVWRVAVKTPVVGGRVWPLSVEVPDACTWTREAQPHRLESGDIAEIRTVRCPDSGDEPAPALRIVGLDDGIVDLLLRVESAHGAQVRVVTGADPVIPLVNTAASDYWGRFRLGVEHILGGFDHLAFVAGIVLLMGRLRLVLIAVTAFTVAHSLTLALSTLRIVSLPEPPVEAVIALSIVFLAREVALRQRASGGPAMTAGRAWTVAFAFGLLHGFGFAGALLATGLTEADLPMTLALFNLGIEAGQIAFVLLLATLLWGLGRLGWAAPGQGVSGTPVERLFALGLGGVAVFWTGQRLWLMFA